MWLHFKHLSNYCTFKLCKHVLLRKHRFSYLTLDSKSSVCIWMKLLTNDKLECQAQLPGVTKQHISGFVEKLFSQNILEVLDWFVASAKLSWHFIFWKQINSALFLGATCGLLRRFLATLVALHFTPVSESLSRWAEFRTSVAWSLRACYITLPDPTFFDATILVWNLVIRFVIANFKFNIWPSLSWNNADQTNKP